MPKIGANTDRTFLLNDVPKQRGVYDFLPPSGNPDNPYLKLIFVNSRSVREVLTEGYLNSWEKQNGDPFTDLNDFFTYIEDFFFRSSVGGSGGSFNYVGEFDNYSDLIASEPAGTAGRFSFVLNSQGTQWLPASMGGTYYGAGWYYDTGSVWSNKNDEIFNGLQDLLDDKLATVATDATINGDGTTGDPLSVNGDLTDEFVKVSVNDTTAAYLISKITSTNSSISLLVENPSGVERIDINLVEPPNDGGIYYRNGLSQDWVKKKGVIKSFAYPSKEQNQNTNFGQFFGILIEDGIEGTYNSFATIFTQISLGAATCQLRFAMYDLDRNLITQGNGLIDNNSDVRQVLPLLTEYNAQSISAYYLVCGVNDNIGGGSVQITRVNANQSNLAPAAFSFNQTSGALPTILPTVASTNNVLYQIYFGS